MARGSLYERIDQLRKKGKNGQVVTDPTVKGLEYQKQGESLYARLRVMNKATGKRDHHPLGPVPDALKVGLQAKWEGRTHAYIFDKSLEEIRAKARSLRLNAREGIVSTAPVKGKTVNELWETYEKIELGRLSEKDGQTIPAVCEAVPACLRSGTGLLRGVTRQEIAELHSGLAKTPYQANRVLSLVRIVFSKGVEWEWISASPVTGIKPFHEHAKEDWYTSEELSKLIAALEANPTTQTLAILLMLYTGARVGEVLKATWDQFDLDAGTWTKSATGTKQKRVHHVALNEEALAVLRAVGPAAGYVFPSPFVPGRPLKDVDLTRTVR